MAGCYVISKPHTRKGYGDIHLIMGRGCQRPSRGYSFHIHYGMSAKLKQLLLLEHGFTRETDVQRNHIFNQTLSLETRYMGRIRPVHLFSTCLSSSELGLFEPIPACIRQDTGTLPQC